jgi:hypothetical protein
MIARVFPSRTRATPTDAYAFVGDPPLFLPPDIEEVHVSVTFSWDLRDAERLAKAWEHIATVKVGGPATGMRGEEFVSGRYVAPGYVITSRGCPNKCWFCSVWRREGQGVRELPITDGYNVLDDNLIACSDAHQDEVMAMLSKQRKRPVFTGGIEAARLTEPIARRLLSVRPDTIYLANDTPDDWPHIVRAVETFRDLGLDIQSHLRCYVIIGYPRDTYEDARRRLQATRDLGIFPLAMLWRHPDTGKPEPGNKSVGMWLDLQSQYVLPRKLRAAEIKAAGRFVDWMPRQETLGAAEWGIK